ncbi:MAG: serine/threonine protein kinase [Chloroflexota bacterium]|nr:MAG: serine/threonine protein kinase [Chloroflexota bacterium]
MAVSLSGYQIKETIHESSNSLVYRGLSRANSQSVILKMLKQAYPSPEKIAWFKREFERTQNLNPSPGTGEALPGVVEAYSLESDQQRWIMVLEDFGGDSLDRYLQRKPFTVTEFLPLALEIADILGQIHQRQIIHKDINPSNIVLHPASRQIKIIDFGISTTLSRENPTLRNPNVLEGTLAYISPEQTGRMNRALDYRSDFYSLGVTFYQMLTGQLPFPSSDALALVHAHLAKQPTPPHELDTAIPLPLSQIVLKLMAKNAEDRYQSVIGLKADLAECLRQWQTSGLIEPFSLGRHDIADRFQLPQKLYGREQEIERLLAAFERVGQGACELMLVSGYAGVGKSALIQEVYRPITRQRGYFIAGKFDQLQRNIPYASLVRAFQSLIQQLLAGSEAEIAEWRTKMLDALGTNAQVIIEIIPQVELIVGPQPAAPDLPPSEAQNRFKLVFQNFIQVFTRPEHPLVLFLDDLQWADIASLDLLRLLLTAPDSQYLFVMGAYRDNEVGEAHPLRLTLADIQQAGRPTAHISLKPLDFPHVNQFMADMLHTSPERVNPLAELVAAKTAGNPFFMNEFLKSLYTESLLVFEHTPDKEVHGSGWRWNLAEIQSRDMTNNVVELMAGKMQRLSQETQQVLKLAACIGNQFDLHTLALVHEKLPSQTAADLWQAITEGLVLPLNDAYKVMDLEVEGLADEVTVDYKFAHDRIQQAAYYLLSDEDKGVIHRQVGQLLLQHTPPEKREQKIFEIVDQLNLGLKHISSQAERLELAELNLLAGQKAKGTAAYQAALNYLRMGIGLLGEDSWSQQYELSLALYVEATEAAYLSGDYEGMEQLSGVVLQHANSLLDKVKVYECLIEAGYVAQHRIMEAIKVGLDVLEQLGLKLPEKPDYADIGRALEETHQAIAGKDIEDLINLPEMTDLSKLATIALLMRLFSPAYIGAPELFVLIVLSVVRLSVKHGNTPLSAQAYASYGLILCAVVGDIDAGYRFGKLALNLVEQFNAQEIKASTTFMVNGFVKHWQEPLRATQRPLLESYQIGLETGAIEYAALAAFVYTYHAYWTGMPLAELDHELVKYSEAIDQLKQGTVLDLSRQYRQAVLNLMGQAENPCRLKGQSFDEETMLPLLLEANNMNALAQIHLNTLVLCYLFRNYPQAVDHATQAEQYLNGVIGTSHVPVFYFYDSLARLAAYSDAQAPAKEDLLEKVSANQEKMKKWAQHAPQNYLHKFYLIEAEQARVLDHQREAREFYEQAIDLARENEYLNEEALAYELAGNFYLGQNQTRLAGHYLRDAHYAYRRWGALAKVKDLEARYPQFLVQAEARSRQLPVSTTPTTDTGEAAASILDLASVLKASQAISGEIVLDRLLEKLMKIVIENAGAQTGILILDKKGRWVIEAEGNIANRESHSDPEVTALHSIPIEHSPKLSPAVINYVIRTRETVVLNDAAHESIFSHDPYIIQNQVKSVLCTPLINQGKLTGLLYLENNLATGAFTPDRVEVLTLLSGQAAISIENASLYSHQVALTTGYSRFMPREFLDFLGKDSIVEIKLGDHVQQEMAVLFSDIRAFTTLSETMTPQENFDFVNAYFGRVSPVIRRHRGIIVKYLGDGMMAVFPERVEDALEASIGKLKQVTLFNKERQQRGEFPIRIGIGIHTGKMMLGTVGEAERMQGDFLSDVVNLTSRLEGLTKVYGVSLIMSGEALNRLKDPSQYKLRFLDKVQVQGRQEAVPVFEVFDGEPEEIIEIRLQTKGDFEQGLMSYYGKQFAEARAYLEQVLRQHPADKAAQLYLKRASYWLEHEVPDDWTGVEAQTQK